MAVDWLWSGESRPKKTWVRALQRAQEDLPLGTTAASALPVCLCIKSCPCVDRDLLCDISHPPRSETLRIRSDSVELLRFLRQAGSSSPSHDEVGVWRRGAAGSWRRIKKAAMPPQAFFGAANIRSLDWLTPLAKRANHVADTKRLRGGVA